MNNVIDPLSFLLFYSMRYFNLQLRLVEDLAKSKSFLENNYVLSFEYVNKKQ